MAEEYSRAGQPKAIGDSLALGAIIRQTRKANGLTQSQLAGLAGTGTRFLSELERGKPNVSLDKTLAVLAVLGLHLYVTGNARP